MSHDAAEFAGRFATFINASMKWCADESEREVSAIYQALDQVMQDVKRRSKMSANAMNAVHDIMDALQKFSDHDLQASVADVVSELRSLSSDQHELQALINPLIEALQFQDLLRQNLENIGKMCAEWAAMKQRGIEGLEAANLATFGETLIKCTTCVAERDIIRGIIPGLAAEAKVDDVLLF